MQLDMDMDMEMELENATLYRTCHSAAWSRLVIYVPLGLVWAT